MNRVILSIAFAMSSCVNAMDTQNLYIKQNQIVASAQLGALSLRKSQTGFSVLKDNKEHTVHSFDLDPALRKLNNAQLALALRTCCINVSQMSNADYKLNLQGNLKGGGAFGAWLGSTLGYGVVTFTGHLTIHLAALCTGPFYPATSATLTKMLTIPIHTAACTAGVAGGVGLGVATGPV